MWPMERRVVPPILRDTLGDGVGHGENLVGVLVEQQVVVAKMRAAHVPVEILGRQVERENIGQQSSESGRKSPPSTPVSMISMPGARSCGCGFAADSSPLFVSSPSSLP